ncbi:MAG: 4-alpha-glucanotransferase [Clostridiales bacterium]|jgi:4-alpha-glucanotransferase|nr:4-alpha-glucanotransferase [Clostridiales bacterium]
MKRSSGILMHISSLPGAYGIGDFGEGAYAFLSFLERANQAYWQILPLGITGIGDSPYQSFSAFAGNPYFIDLDALVKEGFLDMKAIERVSFREAPTPIDYEALYKGKMALLRMAFEQAKAPLTHALDVFYEREHDWLDDFSTFMALKTHHDGAMWSTWEPAYQCHTSEAVFQFKQTHADDIRFWIFTQYLFYDQWYRLKSTANDKGIRIIGDLPIYVAEDSADVWANPTLFRLNEDNFPEQVSGCPPDAFSETGQLWGNPIYHWERMAEDGYAWWIKRFRHSFECFDKVRIDHFRGFESYWSIPYGSETAETGKWIKGPGKAFFDDIFKALGPLDIIAEDLGILTDDVVKLREDLGFPGMKILQFAFSVDFESTYLPHHYKAEDVVYTGTHDNHTIMGWYRNAPKAERRFAKDYLKLTRSEGIHWGFIRALMGSSAGLVVIPMQDYLGLDDSARMNYPSTLGGNWQFRISSKVLTKKLAKSIAAITALYCRNKTVSEA